MFIEFICCKSKLEGADKKYKCGRIFFGAKKEHVDHLHNFLVHNQEKRNKMMTLIPIVIFNFLRI